MSFEDDMIEDGFNDEQDYLDYLCSEADNRLESIHSYSESELNEDEDIQRYLKVSVDDSLIRDFLAWKLSDSIEVRFWSYLWESSTRSNWGLSYGRTNHYARELLECLLWDDWRKSFQAYDEWEEDHHKELDQLEKKVFIDSFINYCSDFIEKKRNLLYLETNNKRLMKMAGISLRNARFDNKVLDVAVWYSSVNDPSQENVLSDYWEYDHKQEWANWMMVNYPYVKDFILQNNDSLSNLIHNIISYNQLDKEIQDSLKYTITCIADNQIGDWWDLFVNDTKNKYFKAIDHGFDDLFYHKDSNNSLPESFDLLSSLFKDLNSILIRSKSDTIKNNGRCRPLSHPELKRVKVVLPGAFREDLNSIIVDSEEQAMIDEAYWKEVEEEMESDDCYGYDIFGEEEDEDAIERKRQEWELEKTHQKELVGEYTPDKRYRILPEELQKYISSLPSTDVSYEDYEYLSVPRLIYYFCKERITLNNIDCLIDTDYPFHFWYKGYKCDEAFAYNELSYERFNDWCYNHNLPTFKDYVIRYWCKELFNENDALLQVWLKFWRGSKWIEREFGTDKKTKEELFDIWMEHHKEEWDNYRSDFMYKARLDAYRRLCLLFDWIREGNYQLDDVLKLKKNEGVCCYREKLNKDFDSWLSANFGSIRSLPAWKEKNASILPFFQEHYKKQRRLKLWNEVHLDKKVFIPGLNESKLRDYWKLF